MTEEYFKNIFKGWYFISSLLIILILLDLNKTIDIPLGINIILYINGFFYILASVILGLAGITSYSTPSPRGNPYKIKDNKVAING